MLSEEWRKFKGWKILEYFLNHSGEIHVKKLARILKISPYTASYYLKLYQKMGIFKKRKKGNLILYSLADNCVTRHLKIFYILDIIYPFIKKFSAKNNVISVILYGSHASGTYDAKSDIDLIIISQRKDLDLSEIKKIERKTGKEVKIHVFTLGEWRRLKRKNDEFVKSVIFNHILVHGAEV